MAFYRLLAFGTFVHIVHVTNFTNDVIILCIVGSCNNLPTNTTILLNVLEILLAYWFIFVEKVRTFKGLITDMTLHTVWMIESIIIYHTISNNLMFTNTALLLPCLVTFGTVGIVIFGVEFTIKFLLTPGAAKTLFMEHLPKSSAAIICKRNLTVITEPGGLVDGFDCPIPNSGQHFWII